MLKSAATSEFVQIKEIKLDKNSQKKVVEVIRSSEINQGG